jgi:hypothetical protein
MTENKALGPQELALKYFPKRVVPYCDPASLPQASTTISIGGDVNEEARQNCLDALNEFAEAYAASLADSPSPTAPQKCWTEEELCKQGTDPLCGCGHRHLGGEICLSCGCDEQYDPPRAESPSGTAAAAADKSDIQARARLFAEEHWLSVGAVVLNPTELGHALLELMCDFVAQELKLAGIVIRSSPSKEQQLWQAVLNWCDGNNPQGECLAMIEEIAKDGLARAKYAFPSGTAAPQFCQHNTTVGMCEICEAASGPSVREKETEWISVGENLPERGVIVLMALSHGEVETGCLMHDDPGDTDICWRLERTAPQDEFIIYGLRDEVVTHWMPLPAPPKTEASK